MSSLQAGALLIEGSTARYVARVHRVKPGDTVELFDPEQATVATAIVESVAKEQVRLEVGEVQASHRSSLRVTLLQGLGKGTKPEQVLRDATALGVQRLVMVDTERAATKVPSGKLNSRRERWFRIAVETARQSGRADLPDISGPLALADALGSVVADHCLVLVPGGVPIGGHLLAYEPQASIAVLIGPEGGLSPQEVENARSFGFQPVSLGENILRTELAAAAVLGVLVAWAYQPRP